MIHTANEFTAQHHRYLVSGTMLGLHSLAGGSSNGEANAAAAEGEKGSVRRNGGVSSASASKASTGFGVGSSRCVRAVSDRRRCPCACPCRKPSRFQTSTQGCHNACSQALQHARLLPLLSTGTVHTP